MITTQALFLRAAVRRYFGIARAQIRLAALGIQLRQLLRTQFDRLEPLLVVLRDIHAAPQHAPVDNHPNTDGDQDHHQRVAIYLDVRLHLKQRRYGDAKKDDRDTRNDRDRSTTTLCRLFALRCKVRNIRMGFTKPRAPCRME